MIFQNEASWRLLAGSGGQMKQYLIDKIAAIKPTGKQFVKDDYKFNDLLKYSWKTWFGDDKYEVRLWLSSYWAERVNPRLLVENQKITKNKDGSIIFECTVNSLNEIAAWVVARGEGIKVIEPDELRRTVIELAEGALKITRIFNSPYTLTGIVVATLSSLIPEQV